MKMLPKSNALRLLPVLASGAFLCLGNMTAAAQTDVAKIVPITPGTCAPVSDGDVLTLEWNPAFDKPSAVTGLRDLSLSFVRDTELTTRSRRGPILTLEAAPPTLRGEVANHAIATLGNGFFQIRFQVSTRELMSGTYRLVAATAIPTVVPDYEGEIPHMLNSPTRSPFCLEVTGIADPVPRHH